MTAPRDFCPSTPYRTPISDFALSLVLVVLVYGIVVLVMGMGPALLAGAGK